MTDFTELSDTELSEALEFHRRQRNLSRGVNESANARQTQIVRILEAEEARRLDELSKKTLGSYVKKAGTDQYLKGQAVQYHTNKAQNADGPFSKETKAKHYDAADKALKKASNRDTGIGRAADRLTKEEVELDEVSASTLRSYIDKSRDSKKAAMKDRTAAEKNVKTYGMASDKKERNDAARRVGNRNQGISVANKKLNTYPTDRAKAKVMAREEVELDEQTMPGNVALRLVDRHQAAAFHHKKNGNIKGYASHFKVAERIEDAVIRAGRDMPVKSKQLEAASDKAFKEHPHRVVKNEEVEISEASYRDSGYANMLKADRKAEKELAKLRAQQAKDAGKKASKPAQFKEESNLRVTKVYNKWPKPATYAVHNNDRSYHKEFDSMEAAQTHKNEKSK